MSLQDACYGASRLIQELSNEQAVISALSVYGFAVIRQLELASATHEGLQGAIKR
jgi:hypothetical protein